LLNRIDASIEDKSTDKAMSKPITDKTFDFY
jgi:hypothetical protein